MAANATNKQISDAINQGIQDAVARGVPEWLGATDALLDVLIEEGDCFSSGEIASYLRTFRPDLVFSVTSSVGKHLQDRFYGCTMPMYLDPQAGASPVEMVPRITGGFSRTPAGTEVFVYGPDAQSASDHDFEVDIPKPGFKTPADPTDAHGLPAKPVQAPTPIQHFVNLTPRPRKDITATVHNDARCCIPRSALEALLHETQTSLKGGDSVYVQVDDGAQQAIIALDRDDGTQGYNLSAARGRVLFPHPVRPFKPGDRYAATVDGPGRRLVVDLSQTL